jgi:hypothetical protein
MPCASRPASQQEGFPMSRISGCHPNPPRPARALIRALAGLALAYALAVGPARAQAPENAPEPQPQLPSAPQPQFQTTRQLAPAFPAQLLLDPQHGGIGRKPGDMSPVGREPQDALIVSMAPHPENSRYWLSGQANIIIQGDLPFHSPYEGTNSFIGRGEYKTSLLGTLYTALRPTHSIRYNTDLILDMESSGGRGLSQALGLAGFTNLDVVRNPTLSTVPYLARYEIHQVIGFTQQTTSQEPGPFALAPSVPLRRIEFRAGKLTLPDFFRLRQPPAVHELDGGQQRRMGLRRRHPRLHGGRHGRV